MLMKLVLPAGACLLCGIPAHAAVTFYTNPVAFQNAVAPGYYTESFDSAPLGAQPGGLNFAAPGGTPAFNVMGDDPGFPQTFPFTIPGGSSTDIWMGLTFDLVPLLFTVTQGSPTAIGGTFANADNPGNLVAGTLRLDIIGQGSFSFDVPLGGSQFVGAVADGPITSFRLSVTNPTDTGFPVANNVILATGVPEPTVLLSAAAGGLCLLARRRQQ